MSIYCYTDLVHIQSYLVKLKVAGHVLYCQGNRGQTPGNIEEKGVSGLKKGCQVLPFASIDFIYKIIGVCGRARSIIPAGESPVLAR